MKQKTLEDKKFQQKLVDKLNNGELSYQNAPIYTILLDLVQGNSVDEVYRVFCEVIKEQNKKLYSEEEVLEHLNHLIMMPSSKLDEFTDDTGLVTMKWFEQFKNN
jgi:Cdc6-like AAA superfamily ATPase